MLDQDILNQVSNVLSSLKANFTLQATINHGLPHSKEMLDFINDFASTSDKLSTLVEESDEHKLQFVLLKEGQPTGIGFRGIPGGHEFTSLLLAVLNADGQGKNLPDEMIAQRIKGIKGPVKLTTYVSLTCTNCPEVVQSLNLFALYNPAIEHEMVDGALFQDEVNGLGIQGVPAVYLNGEMLHSGRGSLGMLLQKLEDTVGSSASEQAITPIERNYDVVVMGGGPAGASAAIYSARKGLKVAIVAERVGGQVNDTVGIENLISVPFTTGVQLSGHLREHIDSYSINVFEHRHIERVDFSGKLKHIFTRGGEVFTAPAVIVATGASWRKLQVDDEAKYIGHGVHFCPHCDGPFYKGKRVAVIGGGNSGVEAAIDLAGICEHVTLLEFANTMRADTVLQNKLHAMPNVDILLSSQTTAVLGNGEKVTALRVKDRTSGEERDLALDGVFVQIGLSPNSQVLEGQVELSPRREIIIDATCRTSVAGIYAAGDVTTVPYKQIVVAMGEGAKAALSAFDDRIRGLQQ